MTYIFLQDGRFGKNLWSVDFRATPEQLSKGALLEELRETEQPGDSTRIALKDGAYYCYCAYVLRISRYSDFLSPMLTNTGIFLRGLKLSGESRS